MGLNTSTGNRVLLKIKGETIGVCQNVSFDDDFGLQEIDGLGDVETQELVTGKLTHRISGEKYFVQAKTLARLGFVPTAGQWLTSPELSIEVIDKESGETVEHYTGCKFATHSRRYTKHTVTGESFSLLARHKEE